METQPAGLTEDLNHSWTDIAYQRSRGQDIEDTIIAWRTGDTSRAAERRQDWRGCRGNVLQLEAFHQGLSLSLRGRFNFLWPAAAACMASNSISQAPALAGGAGRREWEWISGERGRLVEDEGCETVALGDGADPQCIADPALLLWDVPQTLLRLAQRQAGEQPTRRSIPPL